MYTERIKIEKLKKEDLPTRVALLNDSSVRQFLNVSEKFSLVDTIKWFNKIENDCKRCDFSFFLADSPCIIGMGGLSNISVNNKNAELYMYIAPTYQGKGYGKEALYTLCKIGFEKLQLEKIYLYTFEQNLKANSLYEKVGFSLEGVLRKQTYKNGVFHNRFFYGLLKNELKKL